VKLPYSSASSTTNTTVILLGNIPAHNTSVHSIRIPHVSPSALLSLLSKYILTSGYLHIHVDNYNLPQARIICSVLSINPFLQITSFDSTFRSSRYLALPSVIYLIYVSAYSFLYLFFASLSLALLVLLSFFVRPPSYSSRHEYRNCIYITSANISPSLRGGSIGHINGVLKQLTRSLCVLLFSTRNFLVETEACSPSSYLKYTYPTFLFPDIDLYSLAASFHQAFFFLSVFIPFRKSLPLNSFIYTRLSRGSFAAALIAFVLRVPLVVEYNGSEVRISRLYSSLTYPLSILSILAEYITLKLASRIVTVSQPLALDLQRRHPDHCIKWYPNCASSTLLLKPITSPSPGTVSFSYVSTFGRWHGAELIPEAVRFLLNNPTQYPIIDLPHFQFNIIGEGLQYPTFLDSIHKYALAPYFRLHGFLSHDSALEFISRSQFSLLPTLAPADGSDFIGSPTKLFEYMALGSIPIASNVGQQSQILSEFPQPSSFISPPYTLPSRDCCGIIFSQGSIPSFARAIHYALTNSKSLHFMRHNCRARVAKLYTWQAHVDHLLD